MSIIDGLAAMLADLEQMMKDNRVLYTDKQLREMGKDPEDYELFSRGVRLMPKEDGKL